MSFTKEEINDIYITSKTRILSKFNAYTETNMKLKIRDLQGMEWKLENGNGLIYFEGTTIAHKVFAKYEYKDMSLLEIGVQEDGQNTSILVVLNRSLDASNS